MGDHALLAGTIADAGPLAEATAGPGGRARQAPLHAPQHPAEDASLPDHTVDRTNAAKPAQAHGTTSHATLEFSKKRPGLRITRRSAHRKPHDRRTPMARNRQITHAPERPSRCVTIASRGRRAISAQPVPWGNCRPLACGGTRDRLICAGHKRSRGGREARLLARACLLRRAPLPSAWGLRSLRAARAAAVLSGVTGSGSHGDAIDTSHY